MLTLIDIGFSLLLVIVSIVLRNKAAADFLARVILTGHVFYLMYSATASLDAETSYEVLDAILKLDGLHLHHRYPRSGQEYPAQL
ncbi:MAG: hypothetical protein IJJ42_09335 [Clostridia bacterium]|nr:hypothetical protein [Clostridia bacterium]